MKISKKYIEVSEFGFILTPEMHLSLTLIEAIPKTIDSLEAIEERGTNLLTMFPVVANEYYFFTKVLCRIGGFDVVENFQVSLVSGTNMYYYNKLVAWDSTNTKNLFDRDLFVYNLLCKGFAASADWSDAFCCGIKINTS